MTVVAVESYVRDGNLAVPLTRYAQRVGWDECALLGVRFGSNATSRCMGIMTQAERQLLVSLLRGAQQDIESVLRYPLTLQWFSHQRMNTTDVVLQLPHGHIIAMGKRTTEILANAITVDYTAEPAVVVVNGVSADLDIDAVHVYYVGTEIDITPSAISLSGTTLTIEIPRCRLVADQNNPDEGWDFSDTDNFVRAVDIVRVYTDDSIQAELQYTDCNCGSTAENICVYLRDAMGGVVSLGQVSACAASDTSCSRIPQVLVVYYCAGERDIPPAIEDAIIRLAHARMETQPCTCGPARDYWARDRHVPEILDRERLHCPFGLTDGAWYAWTVANNFALRRVVCC